MLLSLYVNNAVLPKSNHSVMHPNDADGMANKVEPDQTAPEQKKQSDLGLHSTLYAQTCLSENLGSLR